MSEYPRVLYLAPRLPARSETFVYNEIFRLRAQGARVLSGSVHAPQRDLEDSRLDALAAEAVPIYGAGALRLLWDAGVECAGRLGRSVGTLRQALTDAAGAEDARGLRRLKIVWQALAALALARRLRPLQIGHIHAHFAHVPATIAMYAARQLGIGFSFTGHANDLFQQRTLLAEKLRRARFVACISHWHRALYQEAAPEVPASRLPVIRCGVDIAPAAPELRRNSPPRILAVGRLVPKKGFDMLVRALGQLRRTGALFAAEVIGDGPERRTLEALIRREGLEGAVKLAGAQAHEAILAALPKADVFVLPCRPDDAGDRDGIPVALMEAMAAGTPVISGDLPAIRELIRHDETGLLVPPGDAAALVEAVRALLSDPDRRGRLAEAGREWVAEEFSAEVNTSRLLAVFAEVMPGGAGATPREAVPPRAREMAGVE